MTVQIADGAIPINESLQYPMLPGLVTVRIRSVKDDYLVCKPIGLVDKNDQSTDIIVARPWLLQKTPFHNTFRVFHDNAVISYVYDADDNQKRVATNESTQATETQVIVPAYNPENEVTLTVSNVDTKYVYKGDVIQIQQLSSTAAMGAVWVEAPSARAWTKQTA